MVRVEQPSLKDPGAVPPPKKDSTSAEKPRQNLRLYINNYPRLPSLFEFHDYNKVLASPKPSTYCMVFAQVQPDNSSDLWHDIANISQDVNHRFRHDLLFFGLSVDKCRETLRDAAIHVEYNLVLDESSIPKNTVVDYYRRLYDNDTSMDRILYQNLMHKCANHEFQWKYNLTVNTFIEYCETTNGKGEIPKDAPESVVYMMLGCLVFFNIFSTLYDYICNSTKSSIKTPAKKLVKLPGKQGFVYDMLTSFSINKNYRKITAFGKDDEEFRFTYFYRFFTAVVVILGHVFLILTTWPVKNPETIENDLFSTISIMFQNCSVLIQIFFVLAGFMTKLKLDQAKIITPQTSVPKAVTQYVIFIVHRYLRFLPSLALLLFFNSKMLVHIGGGPLWRHATENERTFCTQYWWKNLFMLNSFMLEDSCCHHTWYLATDMHLFIFFLFIVMLTAKKPSLKKPIYTVVGILSFVIPGVLTYIYRLDANIFLKPEYYRYLFFNISDMLYTTYVPFYCNFGGYFVGILCAEFYQSKSYDKMKAFFSNYVENRLAQISLLIFHHIIGYGMLFSALLIIDSNKGEPSFWLAFYGGSFRTIWSIFGAFSMVMMLMKFGWIAYDMCSAEICRVLGRITFQMYMWHVPLMRITSGLYQESFEITHLYTAGYTILMEIATILIAAIITLFFEFPMGNIVNSLFKLVNNYPRLPTLFTLHDYNKVVASPKASTYCMVFAQVQPDNSSKLWHDIANISQDVNHRFRHDLIFFGLSVDKCRETLKNAAIHVEYNTVLDETIIPRNKVVDYYKSLYARDASKERILYQHLLHECANHEFQQEYNLTVATFIEYCETTNGEGQIERDAPDSMVYMVLGSLIFLNIFSTFYDYVCNLAKKTTKSPDKKSSNTREQQGIVHDLLTSFSLYKNYKKITDFGKNDHEFRFTYFYRFFTAAIVILGHVFMLATTLPLKNPEAIENDLYSKIAIMFQNCAVLIQIFFVLTGFMTKLKLDQDKIVTPETGISKAISYYVIITVHRYLRFLPSLALILFFNSKMLIYFGDGPLWRHTIESERTFCTQYWWKNIFMLNSFMMDDSCCHQTWYLATDMHLFIFFLFIIMLTAKKPSLKKPIYIVLGILSFVITGVLTYIYRLDANIYMKPEYYRYLFFNISDMLYTTYTPFYCNFGGYLVGLLCAEFYQSESYHKMQAFLSKYVKNRLLQITSLIVNQTIGYGLLFTSLLVIDRNKGEPSLWLAFYGCTFRNIWALYGAFSIFMMLMKFGWIAYDMCSAEICRFLGRITFQMYMWHVTLMRITIGLYHDSFELTRLYTGVFTISMEIVTILVATIITLFVEFPMGNIVNCLLKLVLTPRGKKGQTDKTKFK
uniref:Acyltransferase 3 domain-containing protein n=1 Tax=Stomoxys calcitrans TaxID=35570 RepID=A0A1I8QCX2_STOCA